MSIIEVLKVIVLGIVEGLTEWLPISSTAHLMIADELLHLNMTEEFRNVFFVVIQIGAVLALIVLYFRRLNPFDRRKNDAQKKATWQLWVKIALSCIPAAILGFLLDDWIDENMRTAVVMAVSLIVYGILIIVVENVNKYKQPYILKTGQMKYQTAFYIGLFQVLALIPGASRSATTILGAMLLGCSRSVAVEFSFFMSIPTVFGASFLKVVKYIGSGMTLSGTEIAYMVIGMVTAFIVSLVSVKVFITWIRKHDFKPFGYYRIAVGVILLLWNLISGLIK